MATLAFFPWFALEKESSYGSFHLIPYTRGLAPAGPRASLQVVIDAITKPYVVHGDFSIRGATLLKLGDGELTRDLDQEEVNTVFTFAELLATSGLSHREFFSFAGCLYSNRDAYRIAVQNFVKPDGPMTEITRRRDGHTKTTSHEQVYRVTRPNYVATRDIAELDDALLTSLLSAQDALESEQWTPIYEAIVNFNSANTDSNQVSEQTEAVYTVGALEQLVGSGGKGSILAQEFCRLFTSSHDASVDDCIPLARPNVPVSLKKCSSVKEAWIRDFFQLRGDLAHGKIKPRYPSAWTLREHLLLGSYTFPLLLKCKLAELGCYGLSQKDRFFMNMFQKLACEEILNPVRDEDGKATDWPWNRVIANAYMDQAIRADIPELDSE